MYPVIYFVVTRHKFVRSIKNRTINLPLHNIRAKHQVALMQADSRRFILPQSDSANAYATYSLLSVFWIRYHIVMKAADNKKEIKYVNRSKKKRGS